ncbi:MetS family NSS transporter small subunit [Clostridium sartagoforme]|uniref:MetS family NSS transporter small subunit n=1 Tax=Clostridium sartagoforme TaxID=84031 RepID=A0A4S2DHF8_9CLOT|nr:MetS family NSS transporter small subunit [Clostridium sartagoforme]TGY40972.1 MetS family NSS transporter small subunit [Clostridium sartagoforme]
MTNVAMAFFLLGAVVLWGGLALTLGITVYNEKKESI